ncbi:unnamed protein product, partial [Callosobruchus maculatus]
MVTISRSKFLNDFEGHSQGHILPAAFYLSGLK